MMPLSLWSRGSVFDAIQLPDPCQEGRRFSQGDQALWAVRASRTPPEKASGWLPPIGDSWDPGDPYREVRAGRSPHPRLSRGGRKGEVHNGDGWDHHGRGLTISPSLRRYDPDQVQGVGAGLWKRRTPRDRSARLSSPSSRRRPLSLLARRLPRETIRAPVYIQPGEASKSRMEPSGMRRGCSSGFPSGPGSGRATAWGSDHPPVQARSCHPNRPIASNKKWGRAGRR
ncbi:hypothetical protein HRbin22_02566 [Candidatus Thermoflexus japonica]|uniref:Uncharacterized protein n=1 Tax=Candidatus Thermoflexus japonica TaxID=2035417 RepID=A0A2H5YAA7_9CHLR|nr:hypothetical protein HRbin22_02566 [Candidatus Thermoflexus japonica]